MNSEAGRELRHHGILGQKWGIRRFQNPDGSLTPAGRERYGYSKKKNDTDGNGNTRKSGMPTNLLTTLGIVGGVTLGGIVGDAIDNKIKQHKANKRETLNDKEKKTLTNVFANRKDLMQKYDEEQKAIEEFNKARNKIPELREGSKEYNKYFNKVLDETKDYYKREFGISDEEATEAALEDGQLHDEILRRYYRESNHPAAKEFREKYEKYSEIHKEFSDEVRSTIKNTLGKDIDPIKMERAAYEAYKTFENNGQSGKNVPKSGMPKMSGYPVSEKEKQQFLKENYSYNQNDPTGKWANSIALDNYISRNGKLPDWSSIDNALSEIDDESNRLQSRREKSDKYISKIVNDSYKMDDNGSWNSKNMPKNWTKIIDKIVEASNDKSGNTKAYNDRIDAYNAYKKAINPVKKRQLYEKYLTALSKERSTEGMGQILFTEAVQKEISKLPKEQQGQAQYYVAATYYD